MILAETVLAGVLCSTVHKRQSSVPEVLYATTGLGYRNCFQMASGVSLERKLDIDLSGISGVQEVNITRKIDRLEVTVILNELDFVAFDKVIQKEVELFERFPQLKTRFEVLPAIAVSESPAFVHGA